MQHFVGHLKGPLLPSSVLPGYEWLHRIDSKKRVWLSLWETWLTDYDLPPGYDVYVMSWHTEAINLDRLQHQRNLVDGNIIVLSDYDTYGLTLPGIDFSRFVYWHHICNMINTWYPNDPSPVTPTYKFSAICNRVTQSKVWTVTKLLETAQRDSLVKISNWIESRNVHDWQSTGNRVLDDLTQTFVTKYLGKPISIDGFEQNRDNRQRLTSNPWQYHVQAAVLNFVNESFHYSKMTRADGTDFIYPGPFLTEKTWKCLVGGRAIIASGQFDTYQKLSDLGFEFDYGFDISYDQDPGNISRFERLINLVNDLNDHARDDLYQACAASTEHNRKHITSGAFHSRCESINTVTIQQVLDRIHSQ